MVVVDTDVVSKLARMLDFREIGAILRHHVIHVTTSETVAKEVLAITDPELRAVIAHTLLDMLGEYPLLASLPYQVKWGIQSFLTGKTIFKPFAVSRPDDINVLLRRAKFLENTQLEAIQRDNAEAAERWDKMHAGGRPNLQAVLGNEAPVPNAGDWMMSVRDSEFTHEIVLGTISDSIERARLLPRVAEYIEWNPICSCFLEQLMLAIRRHGLEHPFDSSRKGPKFADYYISAFVSIADLFVTDDTRLRRALEQHRSLRSPANWEVRSLNEFIKDIQDDKTLNYCSGGTLETWPAIEH